MVPLTEKLVNFTKSYYNKLKVRMSEAHGIQTRVPFADFPKVTNRNKEMREVGFELTTSKI